MVATLRASPDPGDVEIHDLVAHPAAAGAVLVTYTTRRATKSVHRSSLWALHMATGSCATNKERVPASEWNDQGADASAPAIAGSLALPNVSTRWFAVASSRC